MNSKKNKIGFTLGEMVTTVAIIGTLTAISVPNYMRVRMQVNMEMVKQHLKTIGTHMNDLYNRDKQFPPNINQLGSSGEEVAITASLFGIDRREYTTNDYTTGPNRSTYQLRTCPKAGRWGIAGDRCFVLTPLGITEDAIGAGAGAGAAALNPWDGTGVPMNQRGVTLSPEVFFNLFSTSRYTPQQRAQFLAFWLELHAHNADHSQFMANSGVYGTPCTTGANCKTPSMTFAIQKENLDQFKSLLPDIYKMMDSTAGIRIAVREKTKDQVISDVNAADRYSVKTAISYTPGVVFLEVGFNMNQRTQTQEPLPSSIGWPSGVSRYPGTLGYNTRYC